MDTVFGERLRKLREDSGYSRERMAELLNIGTASIARYERGENDPTGEVLAKFARFFSVRVDYLLGIDDNSQPHVSSLNNKETHAIAAWRRGERFEAIKVIVEDE